MKILCNRDDWNTLPEQVVRFADWGWNTATPEGYRTWRSRDYAEANLGLNQIAQYLNNAFVQPGKVRPHVAVTSGSAYHSKVGAEILWMFTDKSDSIAFDLMNGWSNGRDFGQCQYCGNIFIPARNQPARFCSTNCRVQWNRKQKGK